MITSGVGKHFTLWHENINCQGFGDLMAETWTVYANSFQNIRGIQNININKVPITAKAEKIYEILQFSFEFTTMESIKR